MKTNKVYNLSIVPIVTIVVGFLSFFLLSIYYKVFWITSEYDSPLIYNVSVMVGDSILLPLLNYKIFHLFINCLGLDLMKKHGQTLTIWILITFIISSILNLSTHLVWVNDELLDFIGFRKGEFSIIGYWHLVYSILQMIVLMIFPFFWFLAIKEKNKAAMKYSYHIWQLLLLFSTLAIFDMLNKYFFVHQGKTLLEAIQIDRFCFSTVIMSFILLFIMKIIEKRYATTI